MTHKPTKDTDTSPTKPFEPTSNTGTSLVKQLKSTVCTVVVIICLYIWTTPMMTMVTTTAIHDNHATMSLDKNSKSNTCCSKTWYHLWLLCDHWPKQVKIANNNNTEMTITKLNNDNDYHVALTKAYQEMNKI